MKQHYTEIDNAAIEMLRDAARENALAAKTISARDDARVAMNWWTRCAMYLTDAMGKRIRTTREMNNLADVMDSALAAADLAMGRESDCVHV